MQILNQKFGLVYFKNYVHVFEQLCIVQDLYTIGEFDSQKNRMFHFMSNVWSSQIVVKSFRIIFYNNLTLNEKNPFISHLSDLFLTDIFSLSR